MWRVYCLGHNFKLFGLFIGPALSCRSFEMSKRPVEWGEHFYLDSQTNEFVCMSCGLRIRRSTEEVNEVNDDPEMVHQALDIDCRRTPSVDGPHHIPPSSGIPYMFMISLL